MEILEYGVKLADFMSPAAKQAKDSIDKLSKSLTTAKNDLSRYQAQLSRANALGDIEGHKKYSALVEGARAKTFLLGNELERMPKVSATAGEGFEAMATELGAIVGPIGAVVAGVTALTAVLGGISFELAKFGIEASEERDQLVMMFDALGEGPGAGQATLDMLDDLEGSLGQSRAKLSEWTQEFEALGITDLSALRYQLNATGASFAIMGDKGAQAYTSLTKKVQEAIETHHGLKIADKGLAALATTGANVTDVAAKMGISAAELRNELKAGSADAQAFGDALAEAIIEKGQGPLDNLRNDLGTILTHAHDLTKKLFDDVDAEPFKAQLADLVSILDEGEPSAQALKAGITGFLDKVYEIGTEALPAVKHFFLDVEILALESYIALYPTIAAFEDLNDSLGPLGISVHNIDLYFRGFLTDLRIAVDLIGALLPGMVKIGTLGIVRPKTAGELTAQGLADGMRGAKEKASGAGEDLGGAAEGGLTKKLEEHSPSRVGIRIGGHLGGGVAIGVQESTRHVERASLAMGARAAEAPRMGFSPVFASAPPMPMRTTSAAFESPYASRGGEPMRIDVGGIHIHGGAQESVKDLTETAVVTLFERLAVQVGR